MPEAITKYAINSTLGTENFEPLDKMIKGQKRFVSDGPIIVADFKYDRTTVFKPRIPGVITFKISTSYSGSSETTETATVYLYSSSGLVASRDIKVSRMNKEFSVNFDIIENEEYTLSVSDSSKIEVESVSLCANIVDNNYFEVKNE